MAKKLHNRPYVWDVFCQVIDNFGDIGVCWRLARQLVLEHQQIVRLWVDDWTAFKRICPDIDLSQQSFGQALLPNLLVLYWDAKQDADVLSQQMDVTLLELADVVIEAFACQLPDRYSQQIQLSKKPPLWINLEYLSAESWVEGCHLLPSKQANGLEKYFFFPGFTAATGGLLREKHLLDEGFYVAQDDAFRNGGLQTEIPCTQSGALKVFCFAYENAPLETLMKQLTQSSQIIDFFLPEGRLAQKATDLVCQHQMTNIRVIHVSFVPQLEFDALLQSMDILFVRGEDSLVRAIWSGKPFFWQIYVQEEEAHLVKLNAFLAYCEKNLLQNHFEAFQLWQNAHFAWNGVLGASFDWLEICNRLPELTKMLRFQREVLVKQNDLASNLLHFCQSKLE